MAGKKDQGLVFVASGMTPTQAKRLNAEIGIAKNKIAPNATARSFSGKQENLSKNIASANRKMLKGGK